MVVLKILEVNIYYPKYVILNGYQIDKGKQTPKNILNKEEQRLGWVKRPRINGGKLKWTQAHRRDLNVEFVCLLYTSRCV